MPIQASAYLVYIFIEGLDSFFLRSYSSFTRAVSATMLAWGKYPWSISLTRTQAIVRVVSA